MEFMERPPGYQGPNLDPTGVRLRPKRLADGVYALMAYPPPRDNAGVIFGQRSALVVDAGINSAMAHQIQRIVRRLTDRPLHWLANTVYHGDRTFGNAAFPGHHHDRRWRPTVPSSRTARPAVSAEPTPSVAAELKAVGVTWQATGGKRTPAAVTQEQR